MSLAALNTGTDVVYGTFGVPAGYLPRGSVEAAVPVTVLVERDLTRFGEVASINAKTAIVCVRKAEVALAPRSQDKFILADGAETLVVDRLQGSDDHEHRVFVA